MIIGTGIDILELSRIATILYRQGDTLWNRILAPSERRPFTSDKRKIEYLAGRFAAKEAASKALGTGLGKVSLHDLIISSDPNGAPILTLHGYAAELASQKGITHLHLSISHSDHYAVAHVIAEAR
ncbi:MAG TPA: holo-ACP synthase [Bacilli bacterium]|nr:holo-ACP synthase [Bacilli bacterium]